jgi:2-amino-4-hydroxy-6-hydroxymethyldihydropteridine diphosphokinase
MGRVDTATEKACCWGMFAGPLQESVVVGLGGNVGDVRGSFRAALASLRQLSAAGRVSSLYRSAAVGREQQDFYNAAVLVLWTRPLALLLEHLLGIEAAQGRVREERWGPRTLDLDLLWAGERVEATSSLTVPHPRLRERRFALLPLIELVPGAVDPVSGHALRQTLPLLQRQEVELVSPIPW